MCHGPRAGLDQLDKLQGKGHLPADHHVPAIRGHLLEMTGDRHGARSAYLAAADLAGNLAQRRYLHTKAAALTEQA